MTYSLSFTQWNSVNLDQILCQALVDFKTLKQELFQTRPMVIRYGAAIRLSPFWRKKKEMEFLCESHKPQEFFKKFPRTYPILSILVPYHQHFWGCTGSVERKSPASRVSVVKFTLFKNKVITSIHMLPTSQMEISFK